MSVRTLKGILGKPHTETGDVTPICIRGATVMQYIIIAAVDLFVHIMLRMKSR